MKGQTIKPTKFWSAVIFILGIAFSLYGISVGIPTYELLRHQFIYQKRSSAIQTNLYRYEGEKIRRGGRRPRSSSAAL